MDVDIPVFTGSRDERLEKVEKWIVDFAERLSAASCDIAGIERISSGAFFDEFAVTFSNGVRVRYAFSKS